MMQLWVSLFKTAKPSSLVCKDHSRKGFRKDRDRQDSGGGAPTQIQATVGTLCGEMGVGQEIVHDDDIVGFGKAVKTARIEEHDHPKQDPNNDLHAVITFNIKDLHSQLQQSKW